MPLLCERCGAELTPGSGKLYRISIEVVADPWPPDISDEDLACDLAGEIRLAIAQAQDLSERESLDQVYRRIVFYLCIPCYRGWLESPAG